MVKVGAPIVKAAAPMVLVGAPMVQVAAPIVLVGAAMFQVGAPMVLIGAPIVEEGAPIYTPTTSYSDGRRTYTYLYELLSKSKDTPAY